MDIKFRCDCPITSALDILGDRWMLVIIKQMLMEGKTSFKDFTDSDEAIATNILSAKLKLLEESGLITKSKLPGNKKANLYLLSDKGLALTGAIVELASWSDTYLRDVHSSIVDNEAVAFLRRDKAAFANELEMGYRKKRASLVG